MGRLRKKPWAEEYLNKSMITCTHPKDNKGKWNIFFGNNNPLWLEIGIGKGTFTIFQSEHNPNINIIGIEKFPSIQVIPIKKTEEKNIENLKFISGDARNILDWFEESSIDKIFINFPDPWPKQRHSKRRLVHKDFLDNYYKILKPGCFIEFKTDQKNLFDFSLDQILKTKFKYSEIQRDLHKYNPLVNKTEYEIKFSEKGNKIHFVKMEKSKV